MAADVPEENTVSRSWLLFRPGEVTMSLPVEFRWEFTRRHPYYIQLWQVAQRYHEQPSSDPQQRETEHAAVLVLSGIGVAQSMSPPDPKLGPEALGARDLGGGWVNGAVGPAMFRTLAYMLLALPAAQRSQLGRLLHESAEFDSQDARQMSDIHTRIADLKEPVWDSFPNVPVISIKLEMPQRAISEAVEQLVKKWKEERGILETRRRDDKLDLYLAVWDLREGWACGEYDAAREKTFRTIARELGIPIDTVISRYRSAFRYLSGHDYTPELWIRLMGPLKLSRHFGNATEGLILRRPWRSPNPRPVTESVLLPGRKDFESPGFLAAASVTDSNIALVDLALDVETLIARGLSNAEIFQSLDLEPPSEQVRDLVDEIRGRHENR